MRRVLPIPACPAELGAAGSPGAKERADVIAHFRKPGDKAEGYKKFKAYGLPNVRDALNEAFGGKCAYCESHIESTQPTAVEHYRPKGGIEAKGWKSERGYYWLAATWENLLPSCTRCNSAEKVVHFDGVKKKSGKGNWFPLKLESKRALAPGEERHEEPLLLHPYYDDPDRHLEFIEEGIVKARADGVGGFSEKGETTIAILGLNRRGLVEKRLEKRLLAEAHIQKIAEYEQDMKDYPQDARFKARRDREIEQLGLLLAKDQEYSAVVAQRIGA
jgi:uncharacterized protein (TIGR02646 family)